MSWRRWGEAAGATAAAVVAAALTLGVMRWVENRYDREFALRIAATTSAYIATVTPPARQPPPPPPPPPAPPPTRPRPVPRARPAPRRPSAPAPSLRQAPPTRDYDLPLLLTNARALRTLPGRTTDVEVYYGTAPLVDATAPPLSPQDLEQLAGAGKGRGAVVPLRDRQGRVVGAVAARPRPMPRGPLPGGLGFAWPMALLAVGGGAAIAFRRLPLRRGGYAAAALLLGIAAYADARATARRSTDRWLADTRRLLQDAATRLPTPASRVPLAELTSLIGPDAELVPGEPGESAPRRLRIDGRRRAVAAILLGPGRWVELRTVPAEDSSWPWLVVLLATAYVGPLTIWTLRWAERTPHRQRRETVIAWGFLAPAALHLLIFSVGPLLGAIYLALRSPGSVVSLSNFTATLRDPLTWGALRNTALYSLYVPVSAAIALLVALLLHAHRGRALRTVFLLPYVSSIVAIGLLWQLIFRTGALGGGRSDWLSDPSTALVGLMLISLWAHVGGQIVVFLAGLQRVPQACLDAARLDGAGAWRRFRLVTFPLLRPVTAFVLVTGVISAFQVFTLIHVLTGGGPLPQRSTDVIVHRVYDLAWGGGSPALGVASAFSLLLFLLLAVLMWSQLKLLGRQADHA